MMETRLVPAINVYRLGSMLVIDGDQASDEILVRQTKAGIDVVYQNQTQSFLGAASVKASLGGGDDTVFFDSAGDRPNATLQFDLGNGNDQFLANLGDLGGQARDLDLSVSGGNGNDTVSYNYEKLTPLVINASAKIVLDGGAGDDRISVSAPVSGVAVGHGRFVAVLTGGGGNDSIAVDITNTGNVLAQRDITLDGGAGNDALDLEAEREGITGWAPTADRFELRGGSGDDILVPIQCNLIGPYDVRESLRVDGGSGNDLLFVQQMWEPAPDTPSTGRLFATTELLGGAGDDSLTSILCNDTPAGGMTEVRADGGAGDDLIRVETERPNPTGDGTVLKIDLAGGDGDDSLVSILCDDFGPADRYFTRLDGGTGDDQLSFWSESPTGTPNTFAAASMKVVIVGGPGDDSQTCSITFNGQMPNDLSVSVDGGAGRDVIRLTLERPEQAPSPVGFRDLRLAATGGSGEDIMTVTFGGSLVSGTFADVLVDGGAGNDRIEFASESENPDSGLPTTRIISILGGLGNDSISVPIRCDLQPAGSTTDITIDGGAGNDRIDTHVEVLPDDLGTTSVRILGGTGDDFLSLEPVGDPKRFGELLLDGGSGFDTARVFPVSWS